MVSVWLMVLLVGCVGFEGKGHLYYLLGAKRSSNDVSYIKDTGFAWIWSLTLEVVRARTTLLGAFWRWPHPQTTAELKAT